MTRPIQMLSKIALGLTLSVGALAATHTASAQGTQMSAKVPFAFSAGNHALPSGTYKVVISAQNRIISLQNMKTNQIVHVIAHASSWQDNKGGARLSFRRDAGQVYLTQVWAEGTNVHSDLMVHARPNRELASGTAPDSSFEIAAE